MEFKTAEQMLKFINDDNDLYSRQAEIYIFKYNEAGSVCTYNIDQEEAKRLAEQVNNSDEDYWGAFLGVGGSIWDDPTHDCYRVGDKTNLDCYKALIKFDDWVLTQHYLTKETKVQLVFDNVKVIIDFNPEQSTAPTRLSTVELSTLKPKDELVPITSLAISRLHVGK